MLIFRYSIQIFRFRYFDSRFDLTKFVWSMADINTSQDPRLNKNYGTEGCGFCSFYFSTIICYNINSNSNNDDNNNINNNSNNNWYQ